MIGRRRHRQLVSVGAGSVLALLLATGSGMAQDQAAPASPATPPAAGVAPAPDQPAATTPDGAPQTAAASAPDPNQRNSCFIFPAKLPDSDVGAFIDDPQSLLVQYGGSSFSLANRVRGLAGSDSRTLDPLVRLGAAANAEQKAAIGAGLGRAAFACARVAPSYAAMIQAAIAGEASPELLTAFLSATNDLQTAALGGSTSSGGGGLSGGGLAGPGSAGLGGDEVVPQTAQPVLIVGRGGGFIIDIDDDDSPANND